MNRSINTQNDRWIAKGKEKAPFIFRTKHPAIVMTFGIISSDGNVMDLIYFKKGERVNPAHVVNACKVFMSRIEKMLEVEGGHIE